MRLTDAQRELLEDKFILWPRASREGPIDLRDYNARAADALKVALSLASAIAKAQAHTEPGKAGETSEGVEP